MSVFTTKSSGRDRQFVVLQHKLKGINYVLNGIKFRDGYAVIEKDSKTYRMLQQIPVLKGAREFPLIFLKELPFITRSLDVRNVFGQEIYSHYLKELDVWIANRDQVKAEQTVEKVAADEAQHSVNKCCYRLDSGKLCTHEALPYSPGKHCGIHLFDDPTLERMGIQIPRFMTKKEKAKLRDKLEVQLTAYMKQKEQDNGETR